MNVYALALWGDKNVILELLLELWEKHHYQVIWQSGPEECCPGMFQGHIETTVPITFSEIVNLCTAHSVCDKQVHAGLTEITA